MATFYEALLDKAFLNGARLNLKITGTGADTKISGTIEKTNFTSSDGNGGTIEYLKVQLIKPITVGMSADPKAGSFDVDHVYFRETLLRTLVVGQDVKQDPDGGVYFVRNKKIGDEMVEMEFVADISSTHTIEYGEPFCVYQEEKISNWLKQQREARSQEKKTRRQLVMEAMAAQGFRKS